jgi:hypothetical protein
MRWNIRPSGHDPRQIDLLAIVAVILVVIAVGHLLTEHPNKHLTSSFIEPSQTVRW